MSTTTKELTGKWDSVASATKQKYSQITDKDLEAAKGDLNKLAATIQKKAGKSRKQIEEFFDECCASGDSMLAQANEFVSNAGESIREGYDQAADQARRGYDSTVSTMAKHPIGSLGVGLGIGLVLGLLIGIPLGAHQERQLTWRDRWRRS